MNNLKKLTDYLAKLADGGICVAFSGGVDSSVLLKAACEVSKKVHAVTVYSDFHSPIEVAEAEKLAKEYGAVFHLLELKLPDEVMQNPTDRCYLCKKAIFAAISEYAAANGLAAVLDGTNSDDLNEYRPGLKALTELKIKSPLSELGFSKESVRGLARALQIPVAEKPSSPCLATRIPYNTQIRPETLKKIDELESYLKSLGFAVARARIHDNLVRIEVSEDKLADLLRVRKDVAANAKALGFPHVTIDLQGFRSGSFDAVASRHTRLTR